MKKLLAAISCLMASLATAAPPGDSAYQLPAALTDSNGTALQWHDLRGKPRVASMFYTSCRYVCPLIVDSLKAIERQLTEAERARIGFVLVSMDPARDTPNALARVMSERRLDPARWRLLQPRAEDVRSIAGILDVRYRGLADGEFNHTTTLVLLDADGRVLARTDRVGAQGDPEFLAAVRRAATGRPAAASDKGSGRTDGG
jgi:protein SCO1/2